MIILRRPDTAISGAISRAQQHLRRSKKGRFYFDIHVMFEQFIFPLAHTSRISARVR